MTKEDFLLFLGALIICLTVAAVVDLGFRVWKTHTLVHQLVKQGMLIQ